MTRMSFIASAADIIELGDLTLQPGDPIGPYSYERRVATGGMAHVLLARDADGGKVALKLLKASRMGTGLVRFKREFRALSRLRHPGVIRVDDWGDLSGHPYIVMEYVEGRDLHREVRGFRNLAHPDRWRRTEAVLCDLAEALAYIHRRGLVHRDVKPSNILVDPDGRCKLTDFGIVKDLDPESDPFVSTTLVGTWAYSSPEQITGRPLDHRSDLYSLGVILYVMLTGRRPFVARDMGGYIALHRDSDPPPPKDVEPLVPEHLVRICLRLMAKAPRDRFQSAQEILVELQGLEAIIPTGAQSEEQVWQPPLVGREVQLDALRDAVGGLTRGDGGVVLIEGDEGVGRSRLWRASLQHARLIGLPVYRAELSGTTGPYAALVKISEDIGRELGARASAELLAGIQGFSDGGGQVAGDLQYRLFDGVRDALRTLLADGPAVIAVDDLHLAPAPLVALLGYLSRTLVVRDGAPLLIIATSRAGLQAGGAAAFRDGSALGQLPLLVPVQELDAEQVARVVAGSVADPSHARALSERLWAETHGNPLYLAEVLRSMRERGTIGDRGLDDEDVTEIAAPGAGMPLALRQLVHTRLAGVTGADRALVDVIACAGGQLDVDVLLDILDEDEERTLDRVDRLVADGLLIEKRAGLDSLLVLSHPKIGEAIYDSLTPARQVDLHRRLGAGLEVRGAANPMAAEAIGEHFRKAGEDGRAWRYLVEAAWGMQSRSLLAEAWDLAQRARELQDAAREQLEPERFALGRLKLLRVRGSTLFNRGAWADARECLAALRGAAMAAGDDALAADAGLDLGSALRRLGHVPEGESLVESVLVQARSRHDRATVIEALHRLASFAWERGDVDECERLASQGLVAATGPNLAANRASILLALTAVQASRGQLAAATAGLREAEDILRNLRKKRSVAVVQCNLAELLSWQGDLSGALQRVNDGIAQARDVLFREGEAFGLRLRGAVMLDAGDVGAAAEDLRASLDMCEALGMAGETVPSRYFSGQLALRRGDADTALAHLWAGLQEAGRQDPERYAPALRAAVARTLSITGEFDRAESLLMELVGVVDGLPVPRRTQVQLGMAAAWTALGDPERALPLARAAAQTASSRGFRTWALRARLLLCELTRGPEADAARAEAAELARGLMEGLPEELAVSFRRQPGFARLWMVGRDA